MYGEHPYGRSILGTEETVCQVSREDLNGVIMNIFVLII